MRVLFVSQYYPPETGAAPTRAALFVQALRRRGHEVVVLTGLPNHPSGEVPEDFRGIWRRVDEGGVIRRWLYASPKKGFIRRLANQVSFGASVWLETLGRVDYDVVVATVPPPFLGTAAAMAARRSGVTYVVDVRDDWPRAAVRLGMLREGLVTRLLSGLVSKIYDAADHLVVVTPGMERWFAARGIAPERISLVTNGADLAVFSAVKPTTPNPEEFRVVYAGTHGVVHGMDAIVDAAIVLKGEPFRFVLIGDGVVKPALQQRAEAAQLNNIDFLPSLQPEDLAGTFADADAFIVTTTADEFCGETIPVKLFDYLAAGRPVVGALLGDAADVLERSGGGVLVQPMDGAAIAEALRMLASDPAACARMAAQGKAFVEENYSRVALGETFVDVVERTSARTGRMGRPARPGGLAAVAKRTIDIVASGLGLVVLSPVLLATAAVVKATSPGPVMFRQRRSGRWGKEFWMYKFRTMRIDTPDVATHLLGDPDVYLTSVGKLLRRTSIDELPQLLNVLRGDMSVVGPRPALYNQYDLIAMRRAADVDSLRPGITGWAQVNGRDDVEMAVKVGLDTEYLDRSSVIFDINVLFRTVSAVFSQRGAR